MEVKDLCVTVNRDAGCCQADVRLSGKFIRAYESCPGGYVATFPEECHIYWEGKSTTEFWQSWPSYETKIKDNRIKYLGLITEAQEIQRALKYKLSELA